LSCAEDTANTPDTNPKKPTAIATITFISGKYCLLR
jgi:hypothetical protein